MAILPTHRDTSPSGSTIPPAPSASSESTHVSRTPTIQNGAENSAPSAVDDKSRRSRVEDDRDDSSEEGDKGYDDKGVIEVEEDGKKRKVRVVLEHKSGKELLKEVAGGEYTIPRWRHSLPFMKPKHGPPPAPLNIDDAPVTPEITAGFFSFLFFNWISPLMALGSARPLQATDLWKMDEARSAGVLSERLITHYQARQKAAIEYNERLADPSTPLPWRQRVKFAFVSNREQREKEYREKDGKKVPSLAWALSDTFGLYFWTAGFIKVAGDLTSAFTPLVIRAIITWSAEWEVARRTGAPKPETGRAVGMAIGLLAMMVFVSICNHHFFLRSMATGVLLRAAIISAVYKRALRLTGKARGDLPNGKIVNHISTDTSRIDFAAGFFHISWTAPIQFIAIAVILLVEIGYSALPGLGFLLVALPFQTVIMKKLLAQRRQSMIWTDKRAKLLQEILGGMRIVKFMAWEIPFLNRLRAIRGMELKFVRRLLWFRSGMMAFALSLPVLAAILAFITYSLTSHGLSAPTVFTVLTLFQLIRMPLMIWPMALSSAVDAHNGLTRLAAVFEAEVINDDRIIDPNMSDGVRLEHASFSWDAAPVVEDDAMKGLKGKHAAAISGQKQAPAATKKDKKNKKEKKDKVSRAELARADISGSPAKLAEAGKAGPMGGGEPDGNPGLDEKADDPAQRVFKLKDITLSVPKGSLTAVVGPIGSGKSSLLQGLMGEMRRTEGKVIFSGSTALCAQTPWIQNATIRENILFGQPWNEERYWAAVRDSCLEADLELLEDGDGTEIGEKGINLSGGQKQRVNIARAIYFNADIIGLDDPLSALDAGVGKALFFNAILGALSGKTRILVTHALHFLPYVDNIVLMDEGRIVEQGTYTELRSKMDGAFARLIKDFGNEDQKDEKDADEEEAIEKALPTKVHSRENMVARGNAQKLMTVEERTTGTMTARTYLAYFKAGKGTVTIPFLLVAVAFYQGFFIMTSFWLVYWQERKWNLDNGVYIGIYAALGIGSAVATFFMGFSNSIMCIFASTRLFNDAIKRVMFAPQWFFDTTPLGRIMNRFSKDMDTVDNTLSDAMRMMIGTLGNIIGSTILIAIIQPYFLVAMAVVTLLYVQNARFYRKSSIEFKRIDAILRSSLYSHFSESLSGIATIRSYGESERFCAENVHRMDTENRAYYPTIINQRWLGIRLDILGSILSFVVAIIVVTSHTVSAANGGLALSTMITVQQSYSWLIRQIAEVENDMVGAERIMHYANTLEQEAPHNVVEAKPPAQWPSEGKIEFKNVRMKYREELPDVLKGLTLSVGQNEKIGVVGRTGAGKSSIMIALFRMAELSGGAIEIDGVDVSKIGLNDLRSGISIIPQDPLLFSGTLRTNIDPFNEKPDHELYDALRRAHLVKTSGRPSVDAQTALNDDSGTRRFTLDTVIEEEGGNLSVGERSLVSLARALVRDSKILVLDEATASVDVATDAKIQETIRAEFKDKTLLCIAHRLRTILSYDRILVMADGKVEEFDTPENLYHQGGAFFEMCQKSSISLDDIRAATALRF